MVSVIFLLFILLGLILFVIERREVKAIFEEQKEKGLLIAERIAQMNLQPLLRWDAVGIEKSIEEQIDENLVYVVIYDGESRPLASNLFIKEHDEIFKQTNLSGEEKEDDYFFASKKLHDTDTDQMLRILEIETPIFARGSPRRWGSIKIGLSLEDIRKELFSTRLMLILIGFVGLFLGIFGATFLARRITRPVKRLAEGTVKISEGDFSQKIEIDSQDEIGDLARNFNEMSHQLQLTQEGMKMAQKKLIQAEKLASIGRIAAGIAHEIRNPLTSVKLNIQKVLGSRRLEDITREHLSISQEGIDQIENFVKELLNFTRVPELQLDRFDLRQVMEESVKMLSESLAMKKIKLNAHYQDRALEVCVDADKIRQVFLNILHNACEAVDDGGQISVSLSSVQVNSVQKARVEIADDGCGIPKKDWENIFEPFYTTKATGFGLGLANARKIVEQHKGSIKVRKKEGKGACFEILFPHEEEP